MAGEEEAAGEKCSFKSWRYSHYFEFVSAKDAKNIVVRCKLCACGKTFSTARNTTSNLMKHLKKQHSTVKLVEKNPGGEASTASGSEPPAKQQRLDFSRDKSVVSGEGLKKLVAGYIVEEMLPISTVDSPSFRRIIEKIPTKNNVKLPVRKTFSGYLEREYAAMESKLKAIQERPLFFFTCCVSHHFRFERLQLCTLQLCILADCGLL